MDAQNLANLIAPYIQKELLRPTRIARLNTSLKQTVWIKRDDELSAGVIGSKLRKYASLLPFLEKSRYDELLLIGGSHSNHIVSLAQLLIEKQRPFKLMLLRGHETRLEGNSLWIHMLVAPENIIWIEREHWAEAQRIATEYQRYQLFTSDKRVMIIPEGALMPEVLPGLLTLPLEVAEYEQQHGAFEHIFIDSGTGITAVAFLLGWQYLQKTSSHLHITLIAGKAASFEKLYHKYQKVFASFFQTSLPVSSPCFSLYPSAISPAFGSVKGQVLQQTLTIARQTGIIMDPVYSVKHFITMQEILNSKELLGKVLFIYSGSSFAAAGFQRGLASYTGRDSEEGEDNSQ